MKFVIPRICREYIIKIYKSNLIIQPVEGLDPAKQLLVVSAIYEHLGVVLHTVGQDSEYEY